MGVHEEQQTRENFDHISRLAENLAEVERKVQSLVEVCQAVADDTLRMCFILDELNRVGVLPTLPWNVATALVELHHAMQAEKNGDKDLGGVPMAERIEDLKREILFLRGEFQRSLMVPEGDDRPDETQSTG
jgi:hypothetical protein